MMFLLLDSRAGSLASGKPVVPMSHYDEDWERYINFAGSAKECCNYANDNTMGDLCVVSDMEGRIKWEWHATGVWKAPPKKRKKKPQ